MNQPEPRPLQRRVLVVSYSQSGQLADILDAFLAPLRAVPSLELVEEVLRPSPPFPFPWPLRRFLDAFPESFLEIPCRLEPARFDPKQAFDLVVLAYQPWYLSPSIPASSFLQSPTGRAVLHNAPVITLVGARNMWCRAHDRVKRRLRSAGARLIGHIALTDPAPNLISAITIVGWMLRGRRDRLLGAFPRPGVSTVDVARCGGFGAIVRDALSATTVPDLQDQLDQAAGAPIVPHLLALETAAARAFGVWSRLLRRVGGRYRRGRATLVLLFGIYLALGIAVLSPLSFLLFHSTLPFRRATVDHKIRNVLRY